VKLRVLVSGRGYDVAENVPIAWDVAEGTMLGDLLVSANARLPSGRSLPPSCLIAVSGVHVGTVARHPALELKDGDEIALIAPVAGG
jgi:molybdopterin converting factor small subunit